MNVHCPKNAGILCRIASVSRTAFLASAAALLLFTSGSKLHDLVLFFTGTPLIWTYLSDPVIPFFPSSLVYAAAALAELIVAIVILRYRRSDIAFYALAYLVALFLLYRFGVWALHPRPPPCGCLGAAGKRLFGNYADRAAVYILCYWGVGLCGWALARRRLGSSLPAPACLLVLVASTNEARADYVSLQGIQKYTWYDGAGNTITNRFVHFRVSIEGDNWRIDSTSPGENTQVCWGGRSNVFDAFVPGNEAAAANAKVLGGHYPSGSIADVTIPWLAFCSSHYFASETERSSLPAPWDMALIHTTAHLFDSQHRPLEGSKMLPETVFWRTSKERLKRAGQSPYLRVEGLGNVHQEKMSRLTDYTKQFALDILFGEYVVLATTNLGGHVWPLKYELKRYYPLGNGSAGAGGRKGGVIFREGTGTRPSEQMFLLGLYEGTVTNAGLLPGAAPLLAPATNAFVSDFRLRDRRLEIDNITYRINDGRWREYIDGEMLGIFREKQTAVRWARRFEAAKRLGIQILLGIVVLAPLAFLYRRRIMKRTQQKTQT